MFYVDFCLCVKNIVSVCPSNRRVYLQTEQEVTFNDKWSAHDVNVSCIWCVRVCVCRDRATAEQCLQHPWLQASEPQETQTAEEILPVEDQEASSSSSSSTSSSTSSPEPPGSTTAAEEEEEEEGEGPVTEELIVMAAYTLGQCRQSSTSEKEALAAEQKAISKRFKFEEPFSALQEVPGEFIY